MWPFRCSTTCLECQHSTTPTDVGCKMFKRRIGHCKLFKEAYRSPLEWCKEYRVQLMDGDGWDGKDVTEAISLPDFLNRLSQCCILVEKDSPLVKELRELQEHVKLGW